MRLIWTRQARNHLREIVSYIATDNLTAARTIKERIERRATHLERQPSMGRPGAIAGTRETIPHPSYRIVYQVTEDTVFILAIVHTSRQWPPLMEDDD